MRASQLFANKHNSASDKVTLRDLLQSLLTQEPNLCFPNKYTTTLIRGTRLHFELKLESYEESEFLGAATRKGKSSWSSVILIT